MSVHFLDDNLARWDDVDGDALVLTFFADERPLRGAAGLTDWRLCGQLSRLIRRERVTGKRGEALMLPPGRRLPFRRIVVFGLGDSTRFDEATYCQHLRWIRDVLSRAAIHQYALQPPGRATGLIGARRALELWFEESDKHKHTHKHKHDQRGTDDSGDSREDDVTIIDGRGGQKEMAEILRYRSRRGS